jgi:flagellar FliJ protein
LQPQSADWKPWSKPEMRRFRFSLETVLRVKRGREDRLQLEFSGILERRAGALRDLAALEKALAEMVSGQSRKSGEALESALIAIFEMSRGAQIERIAAQHQRLLAIEFELEAKRIELVAASRERKVLEKLEEGQREAYLEKLNREEQAFLDELAAHNSLHQARTS